jgi:hypothetical protein
MSKKYFSDGSKTKQFPGVTLFPDGTIRIGRKAVMAKVPVGKALAAAPGVLRIARESLNNTLDALERVRDVLPCNEWFGSNDQAAAESDAGEEFLEMSIKHFQAALKRLRS